MAEEAPAWVTELRLVDHHCHSVVRGELDAAAFGALLTEAHLPTVRPPATAEPGASERIDPFDSKLGLAVRRECAPLLDLPRHAPAADYLARRAELGAAESARRLFAASGTELLFVDHGYRGEELLDLDALAALAHAPVAEVVRLEAVAEDLAARGVSAEAYPNALAAEIARRAETAVACKSILAYRHGFDVAPTRPAPAEVALAAERWLGSPRGGRHSAVPGAEGRHTAAVAQGRHSAGVADAHTDPDGRGALPLTDPVLLRHALWCGVDAGLPLQIHTGFGDSDEDLHRANPVLLTAFCRATQDTGTPIVLLHCYPYHREAAWLAQVFRHVYFDLSLASSYAGHRASELLAEALELAPFGKLMYASDAFGLPELYLIAARGFRRSVAEVLGGWIASGEATEEDARRVAGMLAAGNARRLYRV